MIAEERRERILRELVLRGRVEVHEFAGRLGLSGMTIRRDLAVLAERGLLRRVHGGAVLPDAADAPVTGRRGIGTARRPLATVGLIVPDTGYYFPPLIRGVSETARRSGVRLVLGTSGYDPREEERQLARLTASGVDAIMLATARPGASDEATWETIAAVEVPVVLVERSADGSPTRLRLDAVRSDHAYGAELAVDYLAERGHARVGLICRDTATAPWVAAGHAVATARAGMEPGVPIRTVPSPRWGAGASPELLGAFVDDCLASGTRAVIALPDDLAVGLLDVVEDRGLRVPDDFAIVAYDDEIAALARVPLTAVAPPRLAVGQRALETCMMRLEHRDSAPLVRTALVPTLHERDSA